MFRWKFLVFLCLILMVVVAHAKDLPKYIEKCSYKHDLKDCVMRSANKAIPYIVKGDPEYNIPNMLPMHIPFVTLINTPMLVLNFTDSEIYGLDTAVMVDLIQDANNPLFFTPILEIPKITMKGDYSVSGNVMALKLDGGGKFTVELLKGVYKYPLLVEKTNINGVDYYQTKGKNLEFDFQDVTFDIGNLFGGDAELGKLLNKLLTENWRVLLDEFRPGISNIVTSIISEIFNGIARDVPAKNVFLPD